MEWSTTLIFISSDFYFLPDFTWKLLQKSAWICLYYIYLEVFETFSPIFMKTEFQPFSESQSLRWLKEVSKYKIFMKQEKLEHGHSRRSFARKKYAKTL